MPVYKDGKTWMARFYYENHLGERKQKKKRGFKKQGDAKDYEREFLLKLNGSPEMSFRSLYEEYINDMTPRLKETTIAGKRYLIETKILPYFAKYQITKITVKNVRNWQTWLMKQKTSLGKPFSQTYLKTIHNQLSAIFNYAVKFYNLPFNPAKRAGSIGKKHADGINFWTITEFNQAMSYYDKFDPYYFMFHLLFYSGMRIGELQALTLNDFDYNEYTVSITKSYAKLKGQEIISEPKTPKSKRVITLPIFIFDMLNQYLESLPDYSNETRLFFWHKASYANHLKKAADFTNTKIIRVHDLRHSHASHLIELGFSPILIQERLGHEDVQTTLNTYSHLYPNKQEEVANKLNSFKPKISPLENKKTDKP